MKVNSISNTVICNHTNLKETHFKNVNRINTVNNKRDEIAFSGSTGGILGAVSGEMLALGVTKWFSIGGVLGPVAIFLGGVTLLGIAGDLLENKIYKNKEKTDKNNNA